MSMGHNSVQPCPAGGCSVRILPPYWPHLGLAQPTRVQPAPLLSLVYVLRSRPRPHFSFHPSLVAPIAPDFSPFMLPVTRTTRANLSDKELVLITVIACGGIYYLLTLLYSGKSQVPLLVAVFLGSNMLSRSNLFTDLVKKAQPAVSKMMNDVAVSSAISAPAESSHKDNYSKFLALSDSSRIELLTAIRSLQSYKVNSKKSNDRRRKLFKLMSWRQQKLCDDVGYSKKLNKIDQCISQNQAVLNKIAQTAIENYGLTYSDLESVKNQTNSGNVSSSNYRVIEAMGHFVRDWSTSGESESEQMLAYINRQLNALIPPQSRAKTCILVPGSGLGKISHEIAKLDQWGAVHAIEFSGLMHICNQFIYQSKEKHQILPYIHSCSNFVTTKSQFRSVDILCATAKPPSLTLNHLDFRYFKIPNKEQYENVVVVSAFFIDTAENLIEYFDTIQELTQPSPKKNSIKNGYWINIGPLKYGSAAQVELNSDEIGKIRNKLGWKDIDASVTLNDREDQLAGYITDKESLWQGYYGLTKWTSSRVENERK